jgi:hypothetical protein
MAIKNWDLADCIAIRFDKESMPLLREDAAEKTIPIAVLVRSIVREHYKKRGLLNGNGHKKPR